MTSPADSFHFAKIYNDTENFPNLTDVALELGVSYQTVRNRSCVLRGRKRRGEDVPDLVSRVVQAKPKGDNDNLPTARDHARARADQLRGEVHSLVRNSRYPVVNPDSIVVESHIRSVYDRLNGLHIEKEGTPRTWLSETLRVEPVEDPRGRRFIFTGAQNDAAIHEDFWNNLKAYADYLDADIVVGPWTYETQWWAESNPTSRVYDGTLAEYLCFGQMAVGDKFIFAGEMNTLPTASRPIGDLTTYSRGRWAIFPHPKLQLKSVPSTDPRIQAHQVMTSGAVTKPKVIPRKAGVKSVFHHVIGATIVEFDQDGDLFCRQINADEDGSFYDLDAFVDQGGIYVHDGIKALVAGDVHTRKLNPMNDAATFGFDPRDGTYHAGSLLEALRPKHLLVHDLHDNEARNHHHIHDNAYSYEMAIRNRDNVFKEVEDGVELLRKLLMSTTAQVTVIESNHDLALERYVREGRYRNDGANIRYGLELELAYLDAREKQAHHLDAGLPVPSFSLLEHATREIGKNDILDVKWVHDGKSHMIGEIECGNHGFRGANGARGTVAGFAQLGRKMTIADKHSPEILDGVYVAGCMELQHGYNKGPSGWAVAHVIQYPNNKRAIITLQNGKWRA